ncbi:MAG: flagellar motor switch protein FliN [Gammaproteobacteria bacterium]
MSDTENTGEPEKKEEPALSSAAADILGDVAPATTADAGGGDDWAEALKEQANVEKASLESLQDESDKNSNKNIDVSNLDVILDIPVVISLEVGKAKITIRNLLKLNQGSVVELDRFAGDPLDVYVNGKLIAHGEVVVVNEKFGIRLTDVVSTAERIEQLG